MTEEEKDLIRLKNSILADQAMNALLVSIGEPPDTSFIDDLKRRGIDIPDMTGYVFQDTISDEEYDELRKNMYAEVKAAQEGDIRNGTPVDCPIDTRLSWLGVLDEYQRKDNTS